MNAFIDWLNYLDPDDAALFYGSIALIVFVAVLVLWHVRTPRCALCRVRYEQMLKSRFGAVCSKCHDAVFRMYHYRAPRLSDEQARRILDNLWRNTEDFGFGGDGWKNG